MGLASKINLREGEEIVEVVKPSPLNYFRYYFLAFIIIISASFCVFWLIRQGIYGTVVLGACALASLALVFRAYRRQAANIWVLTTERLIDLDRQGIFNQTITQIEFEEAGDVYLRRRGSDVLFGLGSVVVVSPDDGLEFSLSGIRQPKIVADFIAELIKVDNKKTSRQDGR